MCCFQFMENCSKLVWLEVQRYYYLPQTPYLVLVVLSCVTSFITVLRYPLQFMMVTTVVTVALFQVL